MHSKGQRVFGSRVAVAITAVIVTAVVASGVAAANVPLNSVNSAKIVNGSIQSIDLANNSVTSAKIAGNAVTSSDIAPGAVRASDLAAGTRVVAESETGANLNLAGNGANQVVETLTINAPAAGQLLITASFRPDATVDDIFGCAILVDSVFDTASSRAVEAFGAAPDNDCSTNTGVAVAAGNHTVDLQSSGTDPANDIQHTSLQVLFVPDA